MNDKKILNFKEEHKNIEIPSELGNVIKSGMDKGREEMKIKERKRSRNEILKICASFMIAVSIFTGAVNVFPSFANALRDIPVIGVLVDVLEFKDGAASGGKITDGTDINKIDLVENDRYEDIVLQFSQGDVAQMEVGSFKVRYEENPYTMTFEIGGVRTISTEENFDKLLKSKYVKDVYKIITLDDSLVRFVIEFNGPVKYEVREMKNPASIVLSLSEDESFVEQNKYSVRTMSYKFGESVGILEEKLNKINDVRMIKDVSGKYFVELDSFNTLDEASSYLDGLPAEYQEILLIEERFGANSPDKYPVEVETEDEEENTDETVSETTLNTFLVHIVDAEKSFDGNIEVLEDGITIYSIDAPEKKVFSFGYENVIYTKSKGEASLVLTIESKDNSLTITGVYSDFFAELSKYKEVIE